MVMFLRELDTFLYPAQFQNGLGQPVRDSKKLPSIPGGVEGRVGWGPGQPDLVLNVEVGGLACGGGGRGLYDP